MKKLSIFLILPALLLLTSCGEKKYSKEIWGTFDTVVEVSGYFESEEEFERAFEITSQTLVYYNDLLNIYDDSDVANLKRVNESNGKAVEIDAELFDFISFFLKTERESEGACLAGFGSVTSIWKRVISGDWALPDAPLLEEAVKHIDSDSIKLSRDPYSVTLTDPQLQIDPGAVAKGWAGAKLEAKLRDEGFDNLLINMGGHVIAIGDKNGKGWSVGIRNPEGGIFETVIVADKSVVTSGVYERGVEVNGTLYHHVISPETLYPASHFSSVTVISENSALADALSTALFVSSLEKGLGILERYPDVSAMWIYPDETFYKTENFPK